MHARHTAFLTHANPLRLLWCKKAPSPCGVSVMGGEFRVLSGPCQGNFDGVLCSTDLEPDDAAAILLLAPRLRGVPLLVVLGEAAVDKRPMAMGMLASFGLDDCATVVQGQHSKALWPEAASACYPVPASPKAVSIDVDATDAVRDFLGRHERPFALLLKPPHEMLGVSPPLLQKTVGTLYGSFNLTEFRSSLAGSAREPMEEAAQYERQVSLLSSFKAMLWIERSISVGRDAVLNADGACASLWAGFERHAGLVQHIMQWNANTLRAMSLKLAGVQGQVETALGPISTDELQPGQYEALLPSVESAEKKLAVMRSIVVSHGKQLCHADTLVAACLLDAEGGRLREFARPIKQAFDGKWKPTYEEDASSNVFALIACAGEERATLMAESLRVMTESMAQIG